MIVCVCNAVNEKSIRAAAEDGVRTMRELRMATGCSGSCGRCATMARSILDEARSGLETSQNTPAMVLPLRAAMA